MHARRPVEPWCLREVGLDLDALVGTASLFTVSNGHVGVRGALDEGEPNEVPRTFLASVHERRPLDYPETAYGYPATTEVVTGVPDGSGLSVTVDGAPLDVRSDALADHERLLDLRAGILDRRLTWTAPGGASVRVRSQRLVPLSHRGLLLVRYEVTAVEAVEVVVRSWLSGCAGGDELTADGERACAVHTTSGAEAVVAAVAEHEVSAPGLIRRASEVLGDGVVVTFATRLEAGGCLRVDKVVGYGSSHDGDDDPVRAAAEAADHGRRAGWDPLATQQAAVLEAFWSRADVEVDGDDEMQQAIRFAMFHLRQATAQTDGHGIPAKGLTGTGYDGHTFWDAETYVHPVLARTMPDAGERLLRWRHSILDQARERAQVLGHAGATFPWRTITGSECSGYWPAGTAALHVNADVADAVVRHVDASGDIAFDRDVATEILVETARLWASVGYFGPEGRWHLDGLTGPDEYSALRDDDAYTLLMAQRNLQSADDRCERHPDRAAGLQVTDDERAAWRRAAAAVAVGYDDTLGVTPQWRGSTRHQRWDFEGTSPGQYPLQDHFPYLDLYRMQVAKQASVVLAAHLRRDAFTLEQKRRDFAYYEAITVRDSSLSACSQAVLAAEVGHLRLAHAYAREATLVDVRDLRGEIDDGLHLASLAGGWIALVAGFGGLRDTPGPPVLAPRLPDTLRRLTFRLLHRGTLLRVDVGPAAVRYELLDGPRLELLHHGTSVLLDVHQPVAERPVPPTEDLPEPKQPPGREAGTCDLGRGAAGAPPAAGDR